MKAEYVLAQIDADKDNYHVRPEYADKVIYECIHFPCHYQAPELLKRVKENVETVKGIERKTK